VNKAWQPYALHILVAVQKFRRIEARGDLARDEVLYAATLRHLQTLSEATQMLPDSLKAEFPDIPWREISGFRNILVHNYLGDIDPFTVQGVVERQLASLVESVEKMIARSSGNTP